MDKLPNEAIRPRLNKRRDAIRPAEVAGVLDTARGDVLLDAVKRALDAGATFEELGATLDVEPALLRDAWERLC